MKTTHETVKGSTIRVLAALGVCSGLFAIPTYAAPSSEDDAENADLVITSEKEIYRYVDHNGDIVFQDRPRSQHYDKQPVEPEAMGATVVKPVRKINVVTSKPRWPLYALLAAALSAFISALYVILQPVITRWRNETAMDRCLRLANMPAFTNIQLSDGQRRHIVADRIVKTPAGLLVLGEARFTGNITGTAEQTTWHTTGSDGASSIINPIVPINFASDIVRTLLGEIPVFGRVVYTGNATFDQGRPASVMKFAEFKNGLDHYATATVEPKQLDAAWRHLMRFPRQNSVPVKPLGVGWSGWLRRHWRETLSGSLAFASLALLTVAMTGFY